MCCISIFVFNNYCAMSNASKRLSIDKHFIYLQFIHMCGTYMTIWK